MAGLFVSTVVEVPRAEYEILIRESERNNIIRNLLTKSKYVSTDDLKVVLDVEEPPRGCEKPKTFEEMLGEKEGEE